MFLHYSSCSCICLHSRLSLALYVGCLCFFMYVISCFILKIVGVSKFAQSKLKKKMHVVCATSLSVSDVVVGDD